MAAEAEPNWSHVLSMVPLCLTIIFRCALDSRFYKSKKWCAWGVKPHTIHFILIPYFHGCLMICLVVWQMAKRVDVSPLQGDDGDEADERDGMRLHETEQNEYYVAILARGL